MYNNQMYLDSFRKIFKVIPNIDKLQNKTVLVAGAGGLVCSVIVDFLHFLDVEKKYNISIYAADINEEGCKNRFKEYYNDSHFNYLHYNVTEPLNSSIKFDFIIHGASPANPKLYVEKPVETMLANFMGTYNLLEYAKRTGLQRFLYISSSEVYGNKEDAKPFRENDYGYLDILNPRACYPSSKRASETLCSSYNEEYGIDDVIIRPGHVFGPSMTKGDTRAASQFARDVVEGNNIIMKSEGTQLRSHCYVVDCVSALICVLLNGKSNEAYNISCSNSVSTIKDIAEAYAKAGNKKVIFELPSDVEKRGFNLMPNSSLTSDKLEALHWKPTFSLEDGTRMTIELLKCK